MGQVRFFFYLQKKVYYTRVRIAAARISQIELKERSHSLKCYHKKNLLLLHTCRVYRISHLLIRLRKGMFRYFLKKNSHLPDISDQMPNFFKESYQTYLSEARHQSSIHFVSQFRLQKVDKF